MTDFTCSEFVRRRDRFQSERRKQVLPQAKAAFIAVNAELRAFQKVYKGAKKHQQEIMDNDLRPLQWSVQEAWCKWSAVDKSAVW